MSISVFDHLSYKSYLKAWIAGRPARGHGEKSKMAAHLRCHSAYVTQVLEGISHFSMEQAALLNEFLSHSSDESDFFLLLVQNGRAGNKPLKAHMEKKIQETLERREALQNREGFKEALSIENQAIYYSAWHYAAIHILVSIPEFRSKEKIAERLNLPKAVVSEALAFLGSIGLVAQKEGLYEIGSGNIHVGDASPFKGKHHTHWRLKAIQSLDKPQPQGLHYTSTATVSRRDYIQVRAIMVRTIEEIRTIIRDSPEEMLFCYDFDLFEP